MCDCCRGQHGPLTCGECDRPVCFDLLPGERARHDCNLWTPADDLTDDVRLQAIGRRPFQPGLVPGVWLNGNAYCERCGVDLVAMQADDQTDEADLPPWELCSRRLSIPAELLADGGPIDQGAAAAAGKRQQAKLEAELARKLARYLVGRPCSTDTLIRPPIA